MPKPHNTLAIAWPRMLVTARGQGVGGRASGGAAVGAASGGLTREENMDPGKPLWRQSHMMKETSMLYYVITFFVLAVIASILGFGGLAANFATIAQFLAILFVVLFVASVLYSMVSGRRANPPL